MNSKTFHAYTPVIALIALLLITHNVLACTSFCLQRGDELVFTKNCDWHLDQGLIIINKRNVAKNAILLDPNDKPARWVSKYGSVTFNQYGREMPNGGVNEKGLAVEALMLDETKLPAPDNRPALIAWVQYQLDNCATVKEVIDSDRKVRISPDMPVTPHFIVCDRKGNAATIEFLDGKLVCHTGDELPVKAITNNAYDDSLAYLKRHAGFGGTKKTPCGSHRSLDRFVCAADRIRLFSLDTKTPITKYAFDTLTRVAQGDWTKWMIVYDLKKLEIHHKTLRRPEIKTIQLGSLDFDCRSPVKMININTQHSGLLNPHLRDYDADFNRWLVFYSLKHTPQILDIVGDEGLKALAEYPEHTVCNPSR